MEQAGAATAAAEQAAPDVAEWAKKAGAKKSSAKRLATQNPRVAEALRSGTMHPRELANHVALEGMFKQHSAKLNSKIDKSKMKNLPQGYTINEAMVVDLASRVMPSESTQAVEKARKSFEKELMENFKSRQEIGLKQLQGSIIYATEALEKKAEISSQSLRAAFYETSTAWMPRIEQLFGDPEAFKASQQRYPKPHDPFSWVAFCEDFWKEKLGVTWTADEQQQRRRELKETKVMEEKLRDAAKTVQKGEECWGCGVRCASEKLKRCSRCRYAKYCSQKCQHGDWKAHKKKCKERNLVVDSWALDWVKDGKGNSGDMDTFFANLWAVRNRKFWMFPAGQHPDGLTRFSEEDKALLGFEADELTMRIKLEVHLFLRIVHFLTMYDHKLLSKGEKSPQVIFNYHFEGKGNWMSAQRWLDLYEVAGREDEESLEKQDKLYLVEAMAWKMLHPAA